MISSVSRQQSIHKKTLPSREKGKSGFLQFSQKVDYGLFLLVELARNSLKTPLSLRVIAEKNHMSFFFLQKVAFRLRKNGLILSGRGKKGGYVLGKKPEYMTLQEILEALEGPLNLRQCLSHGLKGTACVRESLCGMRGRLGLINLLVLDIFRQTTLHHFIHPLCK
jgi:Rrf2 family protein